MNISCTLVQFAGDAVDIAAENWRQIRVDDCGIAATDELHERTDFVRDRNMAKAHVTRHVSD
jgi:hypothetical protein